MKIINSWGITFTVPFKPGGRDEQQHLNPRSRFEGSFNSEFVIQMMFKTQPSYLGLLRRNTGSPCSKSKPHPS